MYRNVLILALILIFYPAFANGEVKNGGDGNELLIYCGAAIELAEKIDDRIDAIILDAYKGGFCHGIIRGVWDMHDIYAEGLKSQKFFCVPKEVTLGQLARVVVKFLKDNPAILHENRTALIIMALKNAYPCRAN